MGVNSKDKRDAYYKLSKEAGYRARSAYKLLQIDENSDIFNGITNVVDLCGAPGGWSQVAYNKLKDVSHKIICIDIQKIHSLPGVTILNEDINSLACLQKIEDILLNDKVDLILCDGAPDITGVCDIDEYQQIQLVISAFELAYKIGKEGSVFVTKLFRGQYTRLVLSYLQNFYKDVTVLKPKSSRINSVECFVVCKNLKPVPFFTFEFSNVKNIENFNVTSCGFGPDPDLSIIDFDTKEYKAKQPNCKPINPPYLKSLECRKGKGTSVRSKNRGKIIG